VVPHVVRFLGVTALLSTLLPHVAAAQDQRHPRWEIPGFDFRRDGVWRPYARAVRANRARLRAAGRFAELNASAAMSQRGGNLSQSTASQQSATAVTGTLTVPALLLRFKDSPAPTFTTADYNDVLFGITPTGAATGRPYTYRSFYRELSNGVFDIQGQTYGYATLDSNEVYYVGGTSATCQSANPYGSANCNGIWSGPAQARMQSALRETIKKMDATVDFSQYVDPATGFVPLVLFLHEAVGGECGPQSAPQNHLWAHRFALPPDTTQDDWPGHPGKKVMISDYILQPAVGGANSCTASQIMPIGTVAHETGHGFGLPDLYDTQGPTEGIGQWGLMSSGNFTSPLSPSRMEAWSLNELGWITLAPLTANGTYSFDAAPLSHTAYYVRVQGSNPRGEYYLLENRQRQQSDSALIRIHCQRAGSSPDCPGGLLIWHVDSTKLASGGNALNSGAIHGLALMQADAFGNLDADASGTSCPSNSIFFGCSDRGDAGDLFPGTTLNNAFVFRTNPAAVKNADGSFGGFGVDSIQQLITDRTMSFRLRFGSLTVARASDTTASVQFDAASFKVFRDLLDQGSNHSVDFTDGQTSPNGRTRFHWLSWSDAGAKSHTIIGTLAGGTLTATLGRDFLLRATSDAGGSVTADTAINLTAGDFVPEGRVVHLTPVDGSANFCGWTGDSTTTDSVLTLSTQHPYVLTANFGSSAAITSANARPIGTMGATYADTLRIAGGSASVTWSVIAGALPQGLSLSASGVISGFPHQTGTNFSYTAQVVSCDTQSRTFSMSVTAPTLATSDVTAQLFGPTSPLTADQVRYLDFLGNNNGAFDIGDFLAWVKATGAPLSSAAVRAMQQKGGPR
jgi:M6 family metalloprotease-like protein